MRSISRRLEDIEKKLSIGTEKTVIHTIVHSKFREGTAPDIPETYEDWITYKAALKESIESGKKIGTEILVFVVDPFAEYEARNGLQAGTLSRHELKGKVAFEKLLAKVEAKEGQKATKVNKKSKSMAHK
jgi:hypothetical protein